MSIFDRFQTPYHQKAFPDPQDKEDMSYSTCAGCGEEVTLNEITDGTILDICGMCVHDDRICIISAVQAKTITIDEVFKRRD